MKKTVLCVLLVTVFSLGFLAAQTAQEIVDKADTAFQGNSVLKDVF